MTPLRIKVTPEEYAKIDALPQPIKPGPLCEILGPDRTKLVRECMLTRRVIELVKALEEPL